MTGPKSLDDGPRSRSYYLEAAQALLDAGRPARAIETLREGLVTYPNDAELLCQLAFCQLRTDDARAAQTSAESALAVAPDLAEAHRLLGWAKLGRGRRKRQAVAAFETAARLDPQSPEVLASLAIGRIELGRLRQAEETVDRLSALAPDWDRTHEVRSLLATRRKDWRTSEHATRAQLRSSAQDTAGLFRLAIAQERQGQIVAAIETMHLALKADPNDADTRRALKELIETRYRRPKMPYLFLVIIFQPIVLVALVHYIWVWSNTNRMLQEHSEPVQRLIRMHLRARDAGGCIQVALAVLAIVGFFWTLLTVFAWSDLATPTALKALGGLYLAVGVLSLALWRIKKTRPSL